MRLADLCGELCEIPAAAADIEVTGLSADSRAVAPGHIFVAVPGTRADGGRYIGDAVARGAVAVVAAADAAVPIGLSVPVLRAADPRVVLSRLAAALHPGQPETVVAVTGTSGKTSVAEFTRQILERRGRRVASLGTIGLISPFETTYGSLTTPDPVSLHKTLAALAAEGVAFLAMEASSHGLDQHRLDAVRIEAAAFTNLGRDHMDYHPSVEHYFNAKMRLFTDLLPADAPAVINRDGAFSADAEAVARRTGRRVFTVGRTGDDIRVEACHPMGFAQQLRLTVAGRSMVVSLPLVGAYQVENALVAAALAIAVGEPPDMVFSALPYVTGVKGRLEIVGRRNGGLAVVDYAHKPEALEAALAACRPFATGRLICVFGCGGDRDRGKRPIMGAIAARKADVVIVTDDNPRTEDPATIRAAILAGAPSATEIGDRGGAIRAAVGMMDAGDVVLVAGKGHETGQIVGDTVLPFSDQETLEKSLDAP